MGKEDFVWLHLFFNTVEVFRRDIKIYSENRVGETVKEWGARI